MQAHRLFILVSLFAVALVGCPGSRHIAADGDGDGDSDIDEWQPVAELPPWSTTMVDILFVVDNSGSMAEEQMVLAYQIEILVRELIEPSDESAPAVDDLHIGVISTDMGSGGYTIQTCSGSDEGVLFSEGRLDGCSETYSASDCGEDEECPWLSHSIWEPNDGSERDDPPIWEDFACVGTLGTAGCGFEQTLEASYRALVENTRPGGPNEGFLREESILAVIYVTDEDDCSVNSNEMFNPSADELGPLNVRCTLDENEDLLRPISRYHDAFVELRKGDEHRVVVAGILGIPIDGSWNPGDSIERLRDLRQINPDYPNELMRSCDTAMGAAYPPVRLVELVYSFGTNGYLASICYEDWTNALQAITRSIRRPLVSYCTENPRVHDPDLEQCRVVTTLEGAGPCTHPADRPDSTRTEGWHVDLGLDERGNRRCEVLPADYDGDGCPDGASDCTPRTWGDGLQGWFMDRASRECDYGQFGFTSDIVRGGGNRSTFECRRES